MPNYPLNVYMFYKHLDTMYFGGADILVQIKHLYNLWIQMSEDLRKGSLRHSITYYIIDISKTLKNDTISHDCI